MLQIAHLCYRQVTLWGHGGNSSRACSGLSLITVGEIRALCIDYSVLKKEKTKISHAAKLIISYNQFTGVHYWQLGICKERLSPTAFFFGLLIPPGTLVLTAMILYVEEILKLKILSRVYQAKQILSLCIPVLIQALWQVETDLIHLYIILFKKDIIW